MFLTIIILYISVDFAPIHPQYFSLRVSTVTKSDIGVVFCYFSPCIFCLHEKKKKNIVYHCIELSVYVLLFMINSLT
jgi:hypothetical protein